MKVLFFGRLAEIAGGRELTVPDTIPTLTALRAFLIEGDAQLREALTGRGVRAAVNKSIVTGDIVLSPGDEIAFMPPLSGG